MYKAHTESNLNPSHPNLKAASQPREPRPSRVARILLLAFAHQRPADVPPGSGPAWARPRLVLLQGQDADPLEPRELVESRACMGGFRVSGLGFRV